MHEPGVSSANRGMAHYSGSIRGNECYCLAEIKLYHRGQHAALGMDGGASTFTGHLLYTRHFTWVISLSP